MVASLAFQASKREMVMMTKPLFWITLGTLFYFAFSMFWELGKKYVFVGEDLKASELGAFPMIIIAVRFVFYALALLLSVPGNADEPQPVHSFHEEKFEIGEIYTEDMAFPQPLMFGSKPDYRSEKIL